jgi:hypothetical protein
MPLCFFEFTEQGWEYAPYVSAVCVLLVILIALSPIKDK